MATLTLPNIPDDLHRRLKEQAEHNQRSLDAEAIACLEAALTQAADTEALLARIRERRVRTSDLYLTDEDLQAAIESGRL